METQKLNSTPTRVNTGFTGFLPARYVLTILGSVGFAIVYGLKVNLSVAMVAMLNHTAIEASLGPKSNVTVVVRPGDEECQGTATNVKEADGPFNWNSDIQGIVLSCYFWGYLAGQMPGARIAEMYSAKWMLFFSVFINATCTLLTPICCEIHYSLVVIMRFSEGVGGGGTFPAMHTLLAQWAPPLERSFMSSLTYAGTSLGTVISLLMSGVLADNVGWESVFYVMGGLSLIWCLLWVLVAQDSPQQQKYMSDKERTMIITSLGNKANDHKQKLPVPWKAAVTSAPVLAIMVAQTCCNFGWYIFLIELPFYMKQILKFNMTENALAVSLPFLSLWVFSMSLSATLDHLRVKSIISTGTARKIGTGCASVIPGICLFAICYIGCNRGAAVALMAIAITSIGGMFCGFVSNHIDIAPNFAGTLMAFTNTMGTVPGIVVPIFVGRITHGNQTISAWRTIFFTTIAMYIIGIVVYVIFASGEEQPWNKPAAPGESPETRK